MPLPIASDLPSVDEYKRPGFGLPLDYVPCGERHELFPSALDERKFGKGKAWLPLLTLREITMLRLMNQLTDKPDWHTKVFDESITSRWKAEALSEKGVDITEEMVDWCLSELQYKASVYEQTGAISVYNSDVVKSDTAIPNSLRESLKAAAALLEDVPEREKDWHPGSDNMVLDLIHPSLFPLIYGRTRILPDSLVGLDDCIERSGKGITVKPQVPEPSRSDSDHVSAPYSQRFQWLPCDIDISKGPGNVKIKSYISNLHPHVHRPLYVILEDIISRTIALWNMTLTSLKHADSAIRRIKYFDEWPDDEPEQEYEESDPKFRRRRDEWLLLYPWILRPQPEPFSSAEFTRREQELQPVDLWRDYADRGLQIIVKLANIHLTPEAPEYKGGSWHVEGQLNEHICASAIYYYDSHNISTSRLAFRQQSNKYEAMGISLSQAEDWLYAAFGCRWGDPGIQNVGTIDTREGRLLTWPNVLEHQVQPFRLADQTKPGHRKILALFLVDPNIRITSTANVPCQRRDWWSDAVTHSQNFISSLPTELQNHIVDDVDDFPINLEEAKELRLALMEERKVFVRLQDEMFQQHEFSLCEH